MVKELYQRITAKPNEIWFCPGTAVIQSSWLFPLRGQIVHAASLDNHFSRLFVKKINFNPFSAELIQHIIAVYDAGEENFDDSQYKIPAETQFVTFPATDTRPRNQVFNFNFQ